MEWRQTYVPVGIVSRRTMRRILEVIQFTCGNERLFKKFAGESEIPAVRCFKRAGEKLLDRVGQALLRILPKPRSEHERLLQLTSLERCGNEGHQPDPLKHVWIRQSLPGVLCQLSFGERLLQVMAAPGEPREVAVGGAKIVIHMGAGG